MDRTFSELEAECSRLRGEVHELKKLIEFDRTGLAKALGAVRGLVESWGWLASDEREWGCYAWDERTEAALRDEIRRCFDAIEKTALEGLRASGDRVRDAFNLNRRTKRNEDAGNREARAK